MWNFQNYIALPLESFAKKIIPEAQYTTTDIECGQFTQVMLSIIERVGIEDDSFTARCSAYRGKFASQIPEEDAQSLFDEFCSLSGCPYTSDFLS